jgi:hypothetical protein
MDHDEKISTGGFVRFDNGTPSVQKQAIGYSPTAHRFSRQSDGQPPGPGQAMISGVGNDLAAEFWNGRTTRALQAYGPVNSLRLFGVDSGIDADVARKMIRFAIQYSTGTVHDALGEPIDIAVLTRDGNIKWIARKSECYAQDASSQF